MSRFAFPAFAAVMLLLPLLPVPDFWITQSIYIGLYALVALGLVLLGEGFGAHIPKGYVYFAMGFSVFVELVNIRTTRKTKPVLLNQVPHATDAAK